MLCLSEVNAVGHQWLHCLNDISSLDSPLEQRFGERKPHPDVMRAVWPHILPVWSTATCHYQPGAHWTWEGSKFSFLSSSISYLLLLHSFLSVSYFSSLCFYFIPSALSLSLFLHISLAFPSSLVYFSLSLSLLCFFSFLTLYVISFSFHVYLLMFLSPSLVCCSSTILSFCQVLSKPVPVLDEIPRTVSDTPLGQ